MSIYHFFGGKRKLSDIEAAARKPLKAAFAVAEHFERRVKRFRMIGEIVKARWTKQMDELLLVSACLASYQSVDKNNDAGEGEDIHYR